MYQHDIDYSGHPPWDTNIDEIESPTFNINTHIQDIYAYSAQRKSSYPRPDTSGHLPMNIYEDMDESSRAAWRKVSPDIRTKIVRSMTTSKSNTPRSQFMSSTSSSGGPRTNTRNLNLHNISLHDLLVNYHLFDESDTSVTIPSDNTSPTIADNTNTTIATSDETDNDQLLIQAAKSNAPPHSSSSSQALTSQADIRNLLSQSKKGSTTANMHEIIYRVQKYDTHSDLSLVDRGANGGIAGNDVRVIEHLNRPVDVQVIENHQSNNLHIVTAGGVKKYIEEKSLSYLISILILVRVHQSILRLRLNPTTTL